MCSLLRFRPFASVLLIIPLWVAVGSGQNRTFRDPAGRFSLPLPAGWSAAAAGDMVRITAPGSAYGLVAVIPGGGADQRRVAQFTDQFGAQWRQYQRLQNGPTRLGGAEGAFVLYTGKNPKGVDAVVKALTAPLGQDAVLLLFSCPVDEWERDKAAMESIEHGFALGRGGPPPRQSAAPPPNSGGREPAPPSQQYGGPPPQQYGAPPQAAPPPQQYGARPQQPNMPPQIAAAPPANRGARQLPQGFVLAGRSGPIGQALTASFQGGRSAKAVFSGVFKLISPYFDTRPQLSGAMADPQDHQVQAFFQSSYQGVPVRGLMVLTVDNGSGHTGVLFDREDLFPRSIASLTKQLTASLPAARGGGGGGGARPRPPAPLQRTPLTDGSGFIGLPAGWRITGSYKGVVDASGPGGEAVSLGGYQVAYTNPLPGTPATVMMGPYRPPVPALLLYLDTTFQHALSRGLAKVRIIEQQPVPHQGGQAAYISYEATAQGKSSRGFALVITAPVDNTEWFFYLSLVSAPSEEFPQIFPTLWEMWKSWSVNPAVFRERMDAALQSMRDTYRLIQEAHDNTQRTYDNVNAAWDQVIRGVTTIEDVVSKGRADVSTNSVDDWLRLLNENGYNFQVVPMNELVR